MATTRRTARCTVFVGLLVQVLCWVPSVAAQDPELTALGLSRVSNER